MDKQMKFGFLLVLICSSLAVSEVNHGTIAVIYYTQDKIIVASDSRALFYSDRPPDDTQCKIAAFDGKFLFVSAGLAGSVRRRVDDPVPPWTNQDLARLAYDRLRGFPAAYPVKSMAAEWTELELNNLKLLYRNHPEHILRAADMSPHGTIVDAIFGGIENGLLRLFAVQVRYDKTQVPPMRVSVSNYIDCPEETANFCAMGESEIALEFLRQTSERARFEAKTWGPSPEVAPRDRNIAKAVRVIELTIRYQTGRVFRGHKQKLVGGPIDAVELDRSGSLHWYRKKKNCPEN